MNYQQQQQLSQSQTQQQTMWHPPKRKKTSFFGWLVGIFLAISVILLCANSTDGESGAAQTARECRNMLAAGDFINAKDKMARSGIIYKIIDINLRKNPEWLKMAYCTDCEYVVSSCSETNEMADVKLVTQTGSGQTSSMVSLIKRNGKWLVKDIEDEEEHAVVKTMRLELHFVEALGKMVNREVDKIDNR